MSRRITRVVALVGTLFVAALATLIVVSQTGWFKSWARDRIVEYANRNLRAELTIGAIRGNWFTGIDLHDITLTLLDRTAVAIPRAQIGYSIPELFAGGLSIRSVVLTRPTVQLWRTETGLNVANLTRPRQPGGRGVSIEIQHLSLRNSVVTIGKRVVPTDTFDVPKRLERLDAELSIERQPAGPLRLWIEALSFEAREPGLAVHSLSGDVAIGQGRLLIDELELSTERTVVSVDADVTTRTPTRLRVHFISPHLDLHEIAPVVPALQRYQALAPAVQFTAEGPLSGLQTDFRVDTAEGRVSGDVLVDIVSPRRAVRGDVQLDDLNVATFVPFTERTDVSGQANIQAELNDRTLQFNALVEAFDGTIDARGSVAFPLPGRPGVEYSVTGRAQKVRLSSLPEPIRPPFGAETALARRAAIASPVSLKFAVNGHGPDLDAHVELEEAQFAGATFQRGTEVRISRTDGRMEYGGTGRVIGLDVQRLAQALGIETLTEARFASEVNARFEISHFSTDARGLTLQGTTALNDSTLFGVEFAHLTAQMNVGRAVGRIAVDARFSNVDTARLLNRPALDATVSGTVEAHVDVSDLGTDSFDWEADLHPQGRIEVAQAHVAGVVIEKGLLVAAYRQRQLQIEKLNLSGPDFTASASGLLALDGARPSSLTFTIDTPSLSRIDRVGADLRGEAIIEGTLTGNTSEYRSSGTVSASNVGYRTYSALSIDGEYDIAIPHLDVARATATARLDARQVEIGVQRLQKVRASLTYQAPQLTFDGQAMDGERAADVAGRLLFHPDHRELHLHRLAVSTPGQRWTLPADREAVIHYGNRGVRVAGLELRSDRMGTIRADGGVGRIADRPLQIAVRDFSVGAIDDFLLGQREATGTLTADATLTGSLDRPSVRATLEIVDGNVSDFTFERVAGTVVSGAEGMLDVDLRVDVLSGAWLTARGSVPLTRGGRLDVRIESPRLDLAAIAAVTEEVSEATGTFSVDLVARGTYQGPELEGRLTIQDGAMTVTALQSRYRGIDAVFILSPDLLTVPHFTVLDDEGHVMRVGGELGYRAGETRKLMVTVESENFEFVDNALAELELDTSLRITGDILGPHVEGRAELAGGTVHVDRVLDLLDRPYRTRRTTPATEPMPEPAGASGAPGWSADVEMAIPDTLRIIGTKLRAPGSSAPIGLGDVDVTLGGELLVRKAPQSEIRLVGEVHPVRGTYEFQGRDFELSSESTIAFAGLSRIDPQLDVLATRTVSGVEARVHVGGTLRAPTVDLSSSPPLEQADILSLIVFNQPMNMLGAGERVSLARRAASLAAGAVTSRLAESVASAFEIDVLELDLGGPSLAPSITVGEQFAEGVYLRFRQQFGAAAVSSAVLEYRFSDWLRLQGQVSHGDFSAGRALSQRADRGGLSLLFRFGF